MLNFLKNICKTFYSRRFYKQLACNGKGMGFSYMFFGVLLTLAIPFVTAYLYLPSAQQEIDRLCDSMPHVTIKEQKLSIEQAPPYSVNIFGASTEKENLSIVFDTTQRNSDVAELTKRMKTQKIAVLVTEDFIAVPKDSALEIYNFRDMKNLPNRPFEVNHADWVALGKKLLVWSAPALAVIMLIFTSLSIFLMTVFHSIVASFVARFFAYRADFSSLMRLSAAAAIPVTLLCAVLPLVKIEISFLEIQMIWLAFAIYGLVGVNEPSDKPDLVA